jgi:hypothetical protein
MASMISRCSGGVAFAIEHAATIEPPDQMTDEELMAIIREGQAKEAEERKLSN